jgi:2-methylcitrate dehydratase
MRRKNIKEEKRNLSNEYLRNEYLRITNKSCLFNPADRDHCLQYMVAIGLIFGKLTAGHYSDAVAADPRIDRLRGCMEVEEKPRYSKEYLDPDKRSIANSVQVFFRDGNCSDRVEVEYPLGHRRRRAEGLPLLLEKCRANFSARLPAPRMEWLMALCLDRKRLAKMPVHEFMEMLVE